MCLHFLPQPPPLCNGQTYTTNSKQQTNNKVFFWTKATPVISIGIQSQTDAVNTAQSYIFFLNKCNTSSFHSNPITNRCRTNTNFQQLACIRVSILSPYSHLSLLSFSFSSLYILCICNINHSHHLDLTGVSISFYIFYCIYINILVYVCMCVL